MKRVKETAINWTLAGTSAALAVAGVTHPAETALAVVVVVMGAATLAPLLTCRRLPNL